MCNGLWGLFPFLFAAGSGIPFSDGLFPDYKKANGNCIFHEKINENSFESIHDPSKIVTIEHYNA